MKRSSTQLMLANFASRTVNMAMNVVVTGVTGAVGSYAQGRLEPPPQCYNDTNPSQEIPCTYSANALGIICGVALSIFGIALARGIYKQYCRAAPAVAGAAPAAAPAALPAAAPSPPPRRAELGEEQGNGDERAPTATYYGLPSP